jgi:lipopolysaccharide export system ATP-binding protein
MRFSPGFFVLATTISLARAPFKAGNLIVSLPEILIGLGHARFLPTRLQRLVFRAKRRFMSTLEAPTVDNLHLAEAMAEAPANAAPPIPQGGLEVVSIAKSYDKRAVLTDISLTVGKGEVLGLLGPNGAGKTTCFYSIMGLVRPDSGRILMDGVDVTRLPMYRRSILGLGYLPQETSIFRGMTVEQNIRCVLELIEPDKKTREEELERLLEEFHITRLRNSPAMALSGGERRRCEIARALAAKPSIMLLDEPFAGIDPLSIGDIRELVKDLKRRGIGVLITDHNVRETLDIVDRACIIYGGQVLFAGSPEALVADENVRRLYLGESFTL